LHSNQLRGSLPMSFTNMINLSSLGISYNALYTEDATLCTFLNDNSPGWEDTQTIAPEGVSAEPVSLTSVKISWTPIAYTTHSGGYNVYYGISSGGPYTLFGKTSDKLTSQMEVTGLSLNTKYYFVIQTQTEPHEFNQNAVYSEHSEEVSVPEDILIGDIDNSRLVNLGDAILALQVLARIKSSFPIYKKADVDGDEKIGLEEVVYILRKISGLT
jgi:hypothetical protein